MAQQQDPLNQLGGGVGVGGTGMEHLFQYGALPEEAMLSPAPPPSAASHLLMDRYFQSDLSSMGSPSTAIGMGGGNMSTAFSYENYPPLQSSISMTSSGGVPPGGIETKTSKEALQSSGQKRQKKNDGSKTKILEKNRESARESRRRKKAYVKDLEDKVARLQAELQEMRERFDVYSQEAFDEMIEARTNTLEELLKRNSSSLGLAATTSTSSTSTSVSTSTVVTPQPYSRSSSTSPGASLSSSSTVTLPFPTPQTPEEELVNAIQEIHVLHVEQLDRTLSHYLLRAEQMMQPFTFMKFILWGLDHTDSWFEEENAAGNGIWTTIITELGINDEQKALMMSVRPVASELRREFLRLNRDAMTLRRECSALLERVSLLSDRLRASLSPIQQAKFMVWLQKNKGVCSLVHSLWKEAN